MCPRYNPSRAGVGMVPVMKIIRSVRPATIAPMGHVLVNSPRKDARILYGLTHTPLAHCPLWHLDPQLPGVAQNVE